MRMGTPLSDARYQLHRRAWPQVCVAVRFTLLRALRGQMSACDCPLNL